MNAAAIQPYALLDDQECEQRIRRAKATLGDRLVILGHHYQRDEVFQHCLLYTSDAADDRYKV